jgi:hypothetical protein
MIQTTSKKLRHLLKAKNEACCSFLNSAAAMLPFHIVGVQKIACHALCYFEVVYLKTTLDMAAAFWTYTFWIALFKFI